MTLPTTLPDRKITEEVMAANRPRPLARFALTYTALGLRRLAEERNQFIRSAWGISRLSWGYRRNAVEDEASGDLAGFRRNAAEARRLWRQAEFYIDQARQRSF